MQRRYRLPRFGSGLSRICPGVQQLTHQRSVPALGRVGMLESEARDAGHDVNVKFTDTSGWFSNLRIGEPYAAVKIIVDNASDEILGAHLFGPGYAELINIFALAIKLGLKVSDLKTMVPAYPTVGSDLGAML